MQFVTFDLAYVQRLSAGDSDTERHFVAYFGELLGIKLRARVRSAYLVEEIRQEVFLRTFRLIRRPDGIRQPERLGPLVNSICDNVVLEFRRAGDRDPAPMEESFDRRDDSADVETEMLITNLRRQYVMFLKRFRNVSNYYYEPSILTIKSGSRFAASRESTGSTCASCCTGPD